MLPLVYSELGE